MSAFRQARAEADRLRGILHFHPRTQYVRVERQKAEAIAEAIDELVGFIHAIDHGPLWSDYEVLTPRQVELLQEIRAVEIGSQP